MENSTLLTNAAAARDYFRAEVHELEIQVSVAQAKLETARDFLAFLDGKPRIRRGRPPAPKLVEADAPATAEPELVA